MTTRASSSETSTTGNSNVNPKIVIISRIRPEVRDGVVDRLEVGPADRLQPAQSVGQGDVRGGRTGEEEREGAQHERDGVATLARLQPRRHEAPELEEDHRRRQDQSAEDARS